MNIEQLLEAAKIIEERDEAKKQSQASVKRDRKPTKRSPSYRRAHLRDCLELLKELVPSPPEHQKATTLALLQSAQQYIEVLQVSEKEAVDTKKKLNQERYALQRRLDSLQGRSDKTMIGIKRPRHSEGESSTSSEEIDVENDEETGYASSESEDRFSTGSSAGSDGGLTANSRRVK
ncbi:Max-interacting protein 1 [Desmophyllum pertusum]|uniref:Max-interacting protein 1 n=1 Tax=Desmophyllum pertusum TaxID=174260 RepID=A0A9W9ZLF9_9CNID|nr:Max-interacting protein 1 [Desmophyllum pertusum]